MSHSLVDQISRARESQKDPFAPLTIVCGPAARNDLILALAEEAAARDCAIVGVTVQTVPMFFQSQHPQLAPRQYLDRAVIRAHVAQLLASDDTEFSAAHLAAEAATLRGVSEVVAKLLALPPDRLTLPTPTTLTQACSAIARRVRERTAADYYSEAEVRAQARRQVEAGGVLTAGLVHEDPAVAEVFRGAPTIAFPTPRTTAHPPALAVASYADEEEEVEDVARQIVDAVVAGVPLHRIAVAYADAEYHHRTVRLLQEAGIPVSAAQQTPLWHDPAVSAFFRLVSLDCHRMPRREIANLLATGGISGAPSLFDFDRVTRKLLRIHAGADWERHGGNPVADWVRELRSTLSALWESPTWEDLADGLRQIVVKHLRHSEGLPAVYPVIENLRLLPGTPSQETLVEVLADDLSAPAHAIHEGQVVVGSLDSLVGRQLDRAFLLGVTDDAVPGTFLPDPAITAAQSGRSAAYFTAYRTQLWEAATSCAERVQASYARSSIARVVRRYPSQWFGDVTVAAHPGRGRSFTAPDPVPLTQRDLALVDAVRSAPQGLAPHAQRYARIMAARNEGDLNEFNGLAAGAAGRRYFMRPTSASALEAYFTSPLFFFITHVVGHRVLEDPDASTSVDARDSGTAYHEIFDRWTREIFLDATPRPRSYAEVDWAAARRTLDRLVEEELDTVLSDRYSESTVRVYSEEMRSVVDSWFAQQQRDVQEGWIPVGSELHFGAVGRDDQDSPPLTIDLGGAAITIRGSIDRVDVKQEGSRTRIRVTDFKSGKAARYEDISQDHPMGQFANGKDPRLHLQLALYGEAVREVLAGRQPDLFSTAEWNLRPAEQDAAHPAAEAPPSPVIEARYWLFKDLDAAHATPGIVVDDAVHEQFIRVLQGIYQAVTSGFFPARAIASHWNSPERERLGGGLYDRLAEQLNNQGHILDLSYE